MFKLIYQIFQWIFFLLAPFILLIRGSVLLHNSYSLGPWLSIGLSVLGTSFLMLIYFSFIYDKVTGKIGSLRGRFFLMILAVGTFVGHGIFFMSGANMKTDAVAKEINEVHPILRLAVSTLVHLDDGLIVTDANRKPEDYKKMGLKSIKNSLHYQQNSGYSHALDLRVNGRSERRNYLLKSYFWLMGFNTLRHHGTGDHLHISIQSHERPNAI